MPSIRSLGADLVAVAPQTAERSAEMVAKKRFGFDILRDAGNVYAAELGLRFRLPADLEAVYRGLGIDLEASNGEPSWTLPLPARYVIDAAGVVRDARIHPDYTRRPEPEESLEVLRTLAA